MASSAQVDNDTRGWIMCVISGIACVVGASIICVDILIRLLPGKSNFRIQDSNVFLASSLSLSFGVMIFSALYSILPSSRKYLEKGGHSQSAAAWILVACFVAGFVGIQVVSRLLHRYIPSHVVDCDHTHGEPAHKHSADGSRKQSRGRTGRSPSRTNGKTSESTPLLPSYSHASGKHVEDEAPDISPNTQRSGNSLERKPSMIQVQQRVMSFVKDTKPNCDSSGPCFGYTDPCGQECHKNSLVRTPSSSRHPTFSRSAAGALGHKHSKIEEERAECRGAGSSARESSAHLVDDQDASSVTETEDADIEAQHHHHVAENAFMSIGLQTSIAIAIHKIPEGFITYATNHANPSLGFSVFMALFIHNISEGFALALPLYLAFKSRGGALFWASLLGGASQPLGAAIAAVWFKVAGNKGHKPGSTVYGCMFGLTAGIMASVALQLFAESLTLNHNRNLCIGFGFIGMAIMAMSNALTA